MTKGDFSRAPRTSMDMEPILQNAPTLLSNCVHATMLEKATRKEETRQKSSPNSPLINTIPIHSMLPDSLKP